MAGVLYRKYRSQTFDELIGQTHITGILKNAVKTGSISHAYLFVGSRGTGKTSIARILAKALNCKNLTESGNPCNECDACVSITAGSYLDLIEIDAASNRGIDQIRELKERIEYAPNEGKYKIYIIDEVHMLTTEAFNALLKTLEEPPSHVIFMLATTDVHKLPATILSRCQRYDFRLGADSDIADVVSQAAVKENVKLSPEALQLIVESARGSYRDSLSLLDVVVSGQLESDDPQVVTDAEVRELLGIPDSTMVYHLLDKLASRDASGALDLIDEIDSRGVNLQQFVKYVLNALRTILVSKMKNDNLSEDYAFANEFNQRKVLELINLFLEAEKKLRYASIPSMVIEIAIAEACLEEDISVKQSSTSSTKVVKPTNNPTPTSDKAVKIADPDNKVEVKSESTSEVKEVTAVADVGKLEENIDDVMVHEDELIEDSAVVDDEISEVVLQGEGEISEVNIAVEISDNEINEVAGDVSGSPSELSIEFVNSKWEGLLGAVQQLNGHLYGFMKTAKVADIKDGFLQIEVPFEFHKDRIEAPHTRETLGGIISNIYGMNIPIRCQVNAGIKNKKQTTADIILKNIPKPEAPVSKPKNEEKTAPSSSNGDSPKAHKISKKIEAIFEGM